MLWPRLKPNSNEPTRRSNHTTRDLNTKEKEKMDMIQMNMAQTYNDPEKRLRLYEKVLSTIAGLRHRGTGEGVLMHVNYTLRGLNDRNAGYLQRLSDYYLEGLPPAPQWKTAPTSRLPRDEMPEPGTLAASELAWLQSAIADKDPATLDETTVRQLTRLAVKVADTDDELFLRHLFDPVAAHFEQVTDQANQRLAEQLTPPVIDSQTRDTLFVLAADLIEQRPEIADLPDEDMRRYATRKATEEFLETALTPPEGLLPYKPAAEVSAIRFPARKPRTINPTAGQR